MRAPHTRSIARVAATIVVATTTLAFVAACHRGGRKYVAPDDASTKTASAARTSRPVERQQASGVSAVSGEQMQQAAGQGIEEYLNGRVPGLQVVRDEAGRFSIRIRGAASLGRSDEEPLVIIDGMPVAQGGNSDALRVIDPREVSRVEVLKNASETAMYGSRGANGVLLIRTRSGTRQ